MDCKKKPEINVDSILVELGELGRYQLLQYFLLGVITLFTSLAYLSYIFTAGQLDYRCKIQECDQSAEDGTVEYFPDWLEFAVPFTADGKPDTCKRFQYVPHRSSDAKDVHFGCDEIMFNHSVIEYCDQFVFATNELAIINEFNITCAENEWQLALVGSLGYMAELVVQPVCAYLSDKYGRRPILIATLLLSGLCGLVKSFSVNYAMYATLEFVTAFVSGGAFMTIFIMAIECAGPTKRVFSGTLVTLMFALSQTFFGIVAMFVPNFRTLLQVLNVPILLVLTFIWMIPESIRWLMVNGKAGTAKSILMKAATMNNIQISYESLQFLDGTSSEAHLPEITIDHSTKQSETFVEVLRSRILAIRLFVNMFSWFLIQFVYFGMTIQSVSLAGNKYVNFIVVCGVELPAILLSSLLMEWFGRKWSLFGSLLLTALACVVTDFIPDDTWLVLLLVYLVGKCCASIAYAILYVYSTEQFPTSMRHSTMIACYCFGTVGSILAPFTMLLVSTWPSLPLLIFGGSAIASGIMVLLLPETLNTKLPDTIAEAEHLTTFMQSTPTYLVNT